VLERLSADARRAIVAAHEAARAAGAAESGTCHLLYGLLVAAGDEQSVRLRAIGLTADAVRERLAPVAPDDPGPPPPLTAAEARDLRRELRGRGMTGEEAAAVIARVQHERAYGPVVLDEGARSVVTAALAAGDGDVDVGSLLVRVMDSPLPELAVLLAAVGVTPAAVTEALAASD